MSPKPANSDLRRLSPSPVKRLIFLIRVSLVVAFASILVFAPINTAVLGEFWFFFPIGIFGAIIANSTGTGGGVVFVPIFNAIATGAIDISQQARDVGNIANSTIGMSFIIQSFGMSMGTSVWLGTLFESNKIPKDERCDPDAFLALLFAATSTAVPSLLLTQWLVRLDPVSVLNLFKLFSLALGVILFAFALKYDRFAPKRFRRQPSRGDLRAATIIGLIGGPVTALFSVGIGEFLAVYLILKRFPIHTCVGVAVTVSMICVVTGVWFHIAQGTIIYEIVVWTIPGALLGGAVAGKIANILGAQRLKLFASLWIVGSSLYLLIL